MTLKNVCTELPLEHILQFFLSDGKPSAFSPMYATAAKLLLPFQNVFMALK